VLDPVVVLDRAGKILRSWGRGLYVMPHGIRIDPQGNVTVYPIVIEDVPRTDDGALRPRLVEKPIEVRATP